VTLSILHEDYFRNVGFTLNKISMILLEVNQTIYIQ
jgi:hypothetical protein